MTKWFTVSGRFSEEEKELIEKFENKVHLTDNQLVRYGVSMIVGLLSMADLFSRPDYAFLKDYQEQVTKTMNSPQMQKQLQAAGEKVLASYSEEQMKKIEVEAQRINKELSVFEKKRKRGPKKIIKKRGRPKPE